MNKFELVTEVAEKTGKKKKDVGAIIQEAFDTIQERLAEGECVRLVGFGTFETKERKARIGRNPKNPDVIIEIPQSKAAVFKAGKKLKDAVNK